MAAKRKDIERSAYSLGGAPHLEALESRLLLNGDVTAVIAGGCLKITGDAQANDVIIEDTGTPNQVRVRTGASVTTINGAAGPVVLDGLTKDVKIDLKAGDDVLELTSLTVARNAKIKGGSGDNQVTVDDTTVVGDLCVKGSSGADTVNLVNGTAVGGDTTINLGNGDNALGLTDTAVIGRTTVKAGTGDDTVTVDTLAASGQTTIRTGAGSDVVQIDDSTFGGKFSLDAGSGNDRIEIEVNGAGGGPVSEFTGAASIKGSSGDDNIVIGVRSENGNSAQFDAAVTVDGGSGGDYADILSNGDTGIVAGDIVHVEALRSVQIDAAATGLENSQQPEGNWDFANFNGECVSGLVAAYNTTGTASYKTAAEAGGTYCLLTEAGYDAGLSLYTTGLSAGAATALTELSDIAANPASNAWRTALEDFYEQIRTGTGTQNYIDAYLDSVDINDTSAVYDIAHHTVSAYYADAVDKALWRAGLIDALADVDDTDNAPVMALGAAVWALAPTGAMDATVVSNDVGSYFYNVKLSQLPGMLVSHQAPNGAFYTRFNHDEGYGFTETTAIGALGLIAANQANPALAYEGQILAARSTLASGVDSAGEVYWVIGNTAELQYDFLAGQTLSVIS